jgi:hypothetical protein
MKIMFHSTSKALSSEWHITGCASKHIHGATTRHTLFTGCINICRMVLNLPRNRDTYFGSIKHIHDINMKISLKPKNIIVSSMEDLKHKKAEHKWFWIFRNESNVDLLLRQARWRSYTATVWSSNNTKNMVSKKTPTKRTPELTQKS